MYANIIVDIASEQTDRLFVYRIPEGMQVLTGMRVRIPFGFREKEGFVLSVTEDCSYDPAKVKDIAGTFEDYPALLPELLSLAGQMKDKYHCPLCCVLRMMIPSEMRASRVNVKTEMCTRIAVPRSEIDLLIDGEKRSKKRRLLLQVLSDGEVHSVKELKAVIAEPLDTIRYFADKGTVTLFEREVLRRPSGSHSIQEKHYVLTASQEEALSELIPAIKRRRGEAFLLHGITGSGKTEVYIKAVKECLSSGMSAIILVPEIVLTPQMTEWFRSRFGDRSAVLHSHLSAGEKYDEWRRIRRGDATIVIGARSAVFAPVENLGLIVVDEEHEQSYINGSFPQYDTREVALMRVRNENATLLLASATPSMLSYAMTRRGDYTLLEMPYRANGQPLPQVTVVDMREELRMGNTSMFSSLLQEKLKACISSGHQAMLFINRRGYAPTVKCRQCGYTIKCPYCDVSLTYHEHDQSLHCHYCGYRQPFPDTCPECHGHYLKTLGTGTQKVEEALRRMFPDTGIIRLDVDTTSGKDAYITLLDDFRSGKAGIMIGTQMIAKGLDFPNVTLVGAILADITLDLPDYRSPERAFQLLVQVAGRAGRAHSKGEVIIQTYKPEHYAIQSAARQDYRAFFAEEFDRRKHALYPPFTYMARLLCTADNDRDALVTASCLQEKIQQMLKSRTKQTHSLLYMRCDKCPIEKIQGRYRAQVLMKILNHTQSDFLLAFCQQLSCEQWKADVVFENNPASLA